MATTEEMRWKVDELERALAAAVLRLERLEQELRLTGAGGVKVPGAASGRANGASTA